MFKKIIKSLAIYFSIWLGISAVSLLTYHIINKPIITSYEKYGLQGAFFAAFAIMVIYTILYFIVIGIAKMIDFAFDK
jgi:hypothetical protein